AVSSISWSASLPYGRFPCCSATAKTMTTITTPTIRRNIIPIFRTRNIQKRIPPAVFLCLEHCRRIRFSLLLGIQKFPDFFLYHVYLFPERFRRDAQGALRVSAKSF